MNARNIFSGGLLIFLGVLFLGKELDWFYVDWHVIFRFWPVLLIYLGITMFVGKQSTSATVVTIVLLCIAIPAAIISSVKHKIEQKWDDKDIHIDLGDNDDDHNDDNDNNDEHWEGRTGKQSLSEPMEAAIKTATFNLDGGAAEFKIKGTSTDLVAADTDLDFGKVSLKKSVSGSNADVNFSFKNKHNNIHFDGKNGIDNKIDLKLNPEPEWNMNFEFGAGKADFDLSDFKVKKLSLKTGVTSTDLKLGDKVDNSEITIESGLADVDVEIPASIGCRIKVDGGLNAKTFKDFVKNGSFWESPGYEKATKKMQINFTGGLANLKVRRY